MNLIKFMFNLVIAIGYVIGIAAPLFLADYLGYKDESAFRLEAISLFLLAAPLVLALTYEILRIVKDNKEFFKTIMRR